LLKYFIIFSSFFIKRLSVFKTFIILYVKINFYDYLLYIKNIIHHDISETISELMLVFLKFFRLFYKRLCFEILFTK